MKITLLLIVAWLAAVSAHSSLRHHESSLERLEDFKGRVLNKSDDTEDTAPSNDNNERDNGDDGEDDTKKSRDNADDEEDDEDDDNEDSTTRAHRHGHQRGGDRRFCEFIDIVDDGQDCLDEVIDAVNDLFEGTEVGLYENCNDADDDEVTCLEISDSNDCEEVVNDALNELDEFCISDRGGFDFGDGDRDGIIRLTNHCDKITLFDDGHECLEDVARAIEDEFDDDTLVSLDNRCHGNLCLMMPEDEDDCGDLSDAFVRYTRNKCSSEIRGGYDHHDGYYPNPIRIHITGHGDGHDGDKRDGDKRDTKDTDDTGHSRDLRH